MKGHSMCVCALNIKFSNNDSLFYETVLLWTRSNVWDQSAITLNRVSTDVQTYFTEAFI